MLEEQNEELQAIVLNRNVEEGRNLLNCTANSLAQELGQMDQLQVSVPLWLPWFRLRVRRDVC